jgi:xylulokinase
MDTVTVGLDIGTTSIKAVAVDGAGQIVRRARLRHELLVPTPDRMEHDARAAWRRNPRRVLAELGDVGAAGVGIAAMVPSMTAVDRSGRPLTPGLLYGDARGRPPDPIAGLVADNLSSGAEVAAFLRWSAQQRPDAYGYWPAQAVATTALGGDAAVDMSVAFIAAPVYGSDGWDATICAACGARTDQLPDVALPGAPVGKVGGATLAAGTTDVWCEQLVAGAQEIGDVHVMCGTTLIAWAVVEEGAPGHPGLWAIPLGGGKQMIGGASNAGGLFLDWASRLAPVAKAGPGPIDPASIPIWVPYPRGERTPYHDPTRRAALHELNLTHGGAAVQRAAWEASAFVVRHYLDIGGVRARRIVATGGGTRVDGWMQALADSTGLPVHVAEHPEGAARGAAFVARIAAGLESDIQEASRWAATRAVVEPDPVWAAETDERYKRFLELQ